MRSSTGISQEMALSQHDPLRWIRNENVEPSQLRPIKTETSTIPLKIKKEAVVIDLCSDDETEKEEEDGTKAKAAQRGDTSSVNQEKEKKPDFDPPRQNIVPTDSMNAPQKALDEDTVSQNTVDATTVHEETAFGHEFLCQTGLENFPIEDWQNGVMQNEDHHDNIGTDDQNTVPEHNDIDLDMQVDSSPAPFRFHESSNSLEAETPNTMHSLRMVESSHQAKVTAQLNAGSISSGADPFLPAPAPNQDDEASRLQEQANLTMQFPEQNNAFANIFQRLLQLGQQNLANLDSNNGAMKEYLYIADMPVDPVSEKQLGKRKATDVPRASRRSTVLSTPSLPLVPASKNDDDEENPFAGVPHDPTELPTTCHRCEKRDHEIKMRCRMHERGIVCGRYFCEACCRHFGDEEFQPYIEMYCCARCDRRCDCKRCRDSRRKSSTRQSSRNLNARRHGQGIKTITSAYRDSVHSALSRKRLPQMQPLSLNSSSQADSEGDNDDQADSTLASDMGQSQVGSPWREGARNALADNFALFQRLNGDQNYSSAWSKTANRRHLSEGSDEGIRRFNESSESEDGRATPASSSVASLHGSVPPNPSIS